MITVLHARLPQTDTDVMTVYSNRIYTYTGLKSAASMFARNRDRYGT